MWRLIETSVKNYWFFQDIENKNRSRFLSRTNSIFLILNIEIIEPIIDVKTLFINLKKLVILIFDEHNERYKIMIDEKLLLITYHSFIWTTDRFSFVGKVSIRNFHVSRSRKKNFNSLFSKTKSWKNKFEGQIPLYFFATILIK